MSRLKQLGKDSLIYGIGGIVAKSISFFLLPVYTNLFSPAEYGTIEMLSVISSFLSAFLVMGMDSAQSFFFFQYKKNGKKEQAKLVSAILQWRIIWGSVIVLTAMFLSPLINFWFFKGKLGWEYFALAFWGILFAQIMSQSAEVFRLLYRPLQYLIITLSQSLGSQCLIFILVLFFDQGILGILWGSAAASLCAALIGWWCIKDYINFKKLHTIWWPKILRFGVPLLPASFGMYFMNTADRWFIQYYHGEEELGLYSVGAKFAMLMALTIQTFRKAWWPIAIDAMHSDDGPETFRLIARLFMGLGVAAVVYLTFLSRWLVEWMTADVYFDSYRIVGVLAWQSLFYGFFLIGSAGIWKVEKTYITALMMGLAGLINILLNFLLVPEYGGAGAAVATVTSYFLWNTASLVISERYWSVGFPVFHMLAQIFIGITAGVLLYYELLSSAQGFIVIHLIVLLLVISALRLEDWQKLLIKGISLLGFISAQ